MKIPESQVKGLSAIAQFSPQEVDAILNALSTNDVELGGFSGIVSSVSKEIPPKNRENAEEVVRVMVSLSTLRADIGDLLPNFISDLTAAMAKSDYDDLHLDPQAQQRFRANVTRLLAHEPLNIASKVLYLRTNYEHIYCRARVITDARPVFGDDRATAPAAMIITHMLALHYHQGEQLKDLHLAMDEQDVATLKSLLERAETKQKSLVTLFHDTKVAVITKVRGE